jgi:DNA repair protein RAD7
MLAFAPAIASLTLLNASQFQNSVMEYFIQRIKTLKKLHLHSANLIDDAHWQSFFIAHGGSLESLRLEFLDECFTLDTIKVMVSKCTGLKSLRLEHLDHLADDNAVRELSKLKRLEHFTIRLGQDVTSEAVVALIEAIGNNLRTLAIKDCACLDRSVLTAIQTNCHRITHLKLTGTDKLSFSEFSTLFSNWQNPPLIKMDLSEVGSFNTGPKSDEGMEVVGTHDALESLMAHSGSRLEKLDLHSCRPVNHAALCSAFTEMATYPRLERIDLSFISDVDDFVVGSIARCCPKLEFLTVSLLASFLRGPLRQGVQTGLNMPRLIVAFTGKIYGCPKVTDSTNLGVSLRGRFIIKDDGC